ncbi:hypothetical protein Catovirus_1_152 [Catovirus CTV1]|uniref:Uncharacterized protein n=1 Tax=Catovirus CTV1 TaxID=1977631 RepID=A0A1V0S8R8_9VIRU|nr:hypothetical protein Catovirus_1_152 [Catovirus CTV1]
MINYSYKNSKYLHKINSLRGGNQALLQEIKKSIDDIKKISIQNAEYYTNNEDELNLIVTVNGNIRKLVLNNNNMIEKDSMNKIILLDDINQRYANEKEKFKFGSDGLVILNDFVLALCVLSTKFPDFNLDKFIKKGSLLFKVYSVLKDQL